MDVVHAAVSDQAAGIEVQGLTENDLVAFTPEIKAEALRVVLYHNPRGQTVGPPTTVFGLPLIKPPYGRVTAVDLKTGERLWMVPHGNTPDTITKNPKLQGVKIPNTGAPTKGTGLLVTSTLLLGGEGGTTPVLRAWDKKTGAVVAEIQLPGPAIDSTVTIPHPIKSFP